MAKTKKRKKSGYRPKTKITAYREAYRQLMDYAAKPENRRLMRAAQARFLSIVDAKELSRNLYPYFVEWMLFDYPLDDSGTTLVEQFVKERSQLDEATQERILMLVTRGIPGFFSVALCEQDGWLVLQELGAERPGGYRVKPESGLHHKEGNILEGRLVTWDDEWSFFSGFRQIVDREDRSLATDLRQFRQKYDAEEWRRFMAHFKPRLWRAMTRGGDVRALITTTAQAPKMTGENLDIETIRSLLEKGETARAIRMAETCLQRHPGNREAALLLAAAHAESEQPKEAIRVLEQVVEAEPDDVALRLDLAGLYASIRLWDRAKHVLEPALDFPDHPLAPEIRCAHGSFLYQSGQRDNGRDIMLREIENSPENAQMLHRVAFTLFEGGETEKVREVLIRHKEKAGQLTPATSILLGQCYYMESQWQEALDAFDGASTLPVSQPALGMIGDCAFELGRYTRARQAYTEFLRDESKLSARQVTGVRFRLAYIEWRRGMHERALPHLRQALKASPNDPNALWLLAEIYLLRRETDRAKAAAGALYQAYREHPGLPSLFVRLFPDLFRVHRRRLRYGAQRPRRRFRCRARMR